MPALFEIEFVCNALICNSITSEAENMSFGNTLLKALSFLIMRKRVKIINKYFIGYAKFLIKIK
jgi:hypothetical protein